LLAPNAPVGNLSPEKATGRRGVRRVLPNAPELDRLVLDLVKVNLSSTQIIIVNKSCSSI